ncbi:hypothetical protein AWH62_09630 [Maricaulis sp. W15]|nr:hypothetical protein AWH62_09630 [Maricaulis sp. W15]
MKPRLKTSPAARELIKRFEPFRSEAERGDDGRWVVGYGHRAAAKPGVRVTEDEASLLLIYDVMRAEEVVDDSITGPLSRDQRDALTSFVHDVGVDRFRGSDVARYLFEGRARAAGEALAAFGDGTSPRREAESTLFLDALMPAQPGRARKSEPVELVIKIEHPTEERVLEGAIAGADSPPPPEAYSDLPPPPPPLDAGQVRRREAEDEIARILAAVQALPPEVRQDLTDEAMAPVAEAVSDMRDDPVDARFEAVEELEAETGPDASSEAMTADDVAVEAEAPTEANTDPGEDRDGVAAHDTHDAPATDPESAAERVIARMAEEIGDDVADDPSAAEATDTVDASAQGDTAAEAEERAAPTSMPAPVAAFDLPDGMGLGFVLTNRQPVAVTEPEVDAQTVAEQADVASQGPAELPERYSLDLPSGTGLGYALTSIMQGSFRADAEPETAPVEEVVDTINAGTADGTAPEPEATPEPELDAEIAADAETETPTVESDAEVVERPVSLGGDDTPPPHPAETPAEANGAIGEVAGEPVAADQTMHVAQDDDLGDDPMTSGHDPMSDTGDDFSPSDLAADVHTTQDRPGPRSDDGLWTFLAVLIAGGLLAGFGSVLAASEWDYIIAQREMTLNFGMAIAGFFLVIVAGWQLASIWLSKLKQKAGN